jgi:hypothetical protein
MNNPKVTDAAEKDSYASLRSITSLQRTAQVHLRLACPERKPKDRFFARLASQSF